MEQVPPEARLFDMDDDCSHPRSASPTRSSEDGPSAIHAVEYMYADGLTHVRSLGVQNGYGTGLPPASAGRNPTRYLMAASAMFETANIGGA